MQILGKGYETPKFTSQVYNNYPTQVSTANSVNYQYDNSNDKNLWQNVEYDKFRNDLAESHQYVTPAKYSMNEFGRSIVHAPSDSSLQVTSQVPQIQSINFLDIGEKDYHEGSNQNKDSVFDNFLDKPY